MEIMTQSSAVLKRNPKGKDQTLAKPLVLRNILDIIAFFVETNQIFRDSAFN
jgi:hypothetical protein